MIPKPTITDKGIIAPTTEEVLQGMWSVLVSAFGTDINQALNTPQGQLATSVTATLRDRDDQMIQLMNQVDPQYATGGALLGLHSVYVFGRYYRTWRN